MEQARFFRELFLTEGGPLKAPMIMGLPWVCIYANITSQLPLRLSISLVVRLSCTEINTPPTFLFWSFLKTLIRQPQEKISELQFSDDSQDSHPIMASGLM